MGKHGQASSSWQRVVYAGYVLWRLHVPARTDRRRRRRRWTKKEEKDGVDDDDDDCWFKFGCPGDPYTQTCNYFNSFFGGRNLGSY